MTSERQDDIDRDIVLATQAGLKLVPRPYEAIAEEVGVPASEVMARIRGMLERGAIRRIGAVPNHFALGLKVNAMTVWDLADESLAALGKTVGALDFVTHCYERPRRPPVWPFNLFAMVHGATQEEVARKIDIIRATLGTACRAHEVLVSRRILKKTGLRLSS
ncbi:MAG: Lrp/AsnC family transcriptional regulator [Hyphomicrobiaceae bacterium]|nr:MAG: Lrp/AsnC family transcriptional regulator [Hyphomicrobiaceae bacterium]